MKHVLLQMILFMGAVYVRQITAVLALLSITYSSWYARYQPDPRSKLLKQDQ